MAKTPTIASLRHRILIQTLSLASDGQGGTVETWSTFATVWASVEPKSSRFQLVSESVHDVYDHEIWIRKLDGINEKMRITFRGKLFQIKTIEDAFNEKLFFQKLKCEMNGDGT